MHEREREREKFHSNLESTQSMNWTKIESNILVSDQRRKMKKDFMENVLEDNSSYSYSYAVI